MGRLFYVLLFADAVIVVIFVVAVADAVIVVKKEWWCHRLAFSASSVTLSILL